jgi:Kef-type K+ transport system membrane component KefB
MTLPQLLLDLVIIYAAAKIGGELAERFGQPSVLGELLGGIVVGVSGFHLIDPKAEVLHLLAELGVLILLFEVGLETKLKDLREAGPQAIAVALIGVALPFALGFGLSWAFGLGPLVAFLVGAALTATSIGISARVLSDQGLLTSALGSIILGAAVLDDVIGVSLLGIVSSVAERGSVTPMQIALSVGSSLGFLVVIMLVGQRLTAVLMRLVAFLRSRGILLVTFTAFAFLLAYLADAFGSAALLGAFAAGLLLEDTEQKHDLETQIQPVVDILAPIFFVTVGASLNLLSLNPLDPAARPMLLFTALLIVAATAGKLAAGLGAWKRETSRMAVGVGMLARGEVGLIFAGVGATTGILTAPLYAALVTTIAVTTLIAPPWLKRITSREPAAGTTAPP